MGDTAVEKKDVVNLAEGDVNSKESTHAPSGEELEGAMEKELSTSEGEKIEVDRARTLLLSGLPGSLADESEQSLKDVVNEILEAALQISTSDWVESIVRLPAVQGHGADDAVQAVVTFRSRIHKHRVFTQRAKFEKPTEMTQITAEDMDRLGFVAPKAKAEATNGSAEASEAKGDGQDMKKETPNKNKTDSTSATSSPARKGGFVSIPKKMADPNFVVDWDGVPEFQWRIPDTPEEASQLLIENISYGDLDSAWLYQSIMRARKVDFTFTSSTNPPQNAFDHNNLRRGTLILTYPSDSIAMAQAVNGLICVRTRPNKRIKVFLPQTPRTSEMRGQLERKLGRVHKPNLKSRQLLVRNVPSKISVEELKSAFYKVDNDKVEEITFKEDKENRRCAIVTFTTPEEAIWAHVKHDEVKVSPQSSDKRSAKYARVFYMQDVVDDALLLKAEMFGGGRGGSESRGRGRGGFEGRGRGRGGGFSPRGRGGPPPPRRGGFDNARGGGRVGNSFVGDRRPNNDDYRKRPREDDRGFGGEDKRPRNFPAREPVPLFEDRHRGPPEPWARNEPQPPPPAPRAVPQEDPMAMQEMMLAQEQQLQMQQRILKQNELIKELADELKRQQQPAAAPVAASSSRPYGYGPGPDTDNLPYMR